VVYKPAGAANRTIPAQDIIDITYDVPASVKLTYRSGVAEERKSLDTSTKEEDRKRASNEALKSYQEVLSKLTGEKSKFAERQIRYKIARLQASRAEDDPSQRDAAIAGLAKFKQDYPDGWQLSHCAKLLAQLQVDKGDIDAARNTFEQLAATMNISKEIRRECDLRIVELLILAKKVPDAQARLQAMLKDVPAGDAQTARISIYQAECQGASGKLAEAAAELEGIIAKTTDKDLKALAYNALGDCYRLNQRPKEALWPYLWVDVVYHQDRDEHVKAMAELAKIFEEQGDMARAKEYKDKIKREAR
jgi:tetratricopeptide (TPR) repeat protein